MAQDGIRVHVALGSSLIPSTDYDAWKDLLARAMVLGVPERVVMQIMG